MAKFIVPLFVTRESKIIGPLTFAQFVLVAIAGAICFLLYFLFGRKNIIAFIPIVILVMGASLALAFLKMGGHTLPMALENFFNYIIGPRIFIWQRKFLPPKVRKMEKFKKTETKETALKIVRESSLYKLFTEVETKKIK